MMLITSIIFVLTMIFFIIQFMLSEIYSSSDYCFSPLESGFEMLKASMFISSPFFLLAVLFVFFDMEIILILPSVSTFLTINSILMLLTLFIFVFISLLMEWLFSGLKWSI